MTFLSSLDSKYALFLVPLMAATSQLDDKTSSVLESNPVTQPESVYTASYKVETAFDDIDFDKLMLPETFEEKASHILTEFVSSLIGNMEEPDREASEILEKYLWDLV